MRTISSLLVAASVFPFLAGCASLFPNAAGVGRLPAAAFSASETGVVVFSAGAPGRCHMYPTHVIVSSEESGRPVSGVPMISVDAKLARSDFEDHQGSLSALQLPAGRYYLEPTILNPLVQTRSRPTYGFEVRAGETTYAGELFMPRSCSTSTMFVVRDQYDRDVGLARQRNPALDARPVTRRLMWLRSGGREQR